MRKSNSSNVREAWVLFFLLGFVMLNYPFIHIFNKDTLFFGIPALVLYFLVGWPISIGVIFLFCRKLDDTEPGEPETDRGEEQE